MGKLYVYSTKTYMNPRTIHTPDGDVNYGSWFKIGMTEQDDSDVRVKQQDGTSNPEKLITQLIFNGDRYFDLEPYDISAYDAEQHIHSYFRDKGREVRVDASREWFECTMDEIREAIQHIIDPEAHKMILKLMPHQIEAYNFIIDRFSNGADQILLNHKPRSGKTFIVYNFLLTTKPKNVLLFTNYPVLNNQWINDAKKIKGLDYDFVNMSQDEVDEVILHDGTPNFVLCSFQDGKGGDEIFGKKKFELLKKINWDLVVIDECHKAKETQRTDILLDKIKFNKLIGLSATPTKNLLRGTFTKENTHVYNIVDEAKFKKEYPDIYTLPDISYWMYNVPDSVRKELKFYSEEEQFEWNKFLSVKDGRLVYKNDLRIFFMWIAGYYGGGINAPLKKFDANSVLLFVQNNECQSLLLDLLNEIPFYRENYNIHYTNSEVGGDSNRLLEKTKTLYIPRDGKKCIVIANRQLTTGITLKYCDMVMFMNEWASIDEYIQASFRCQSPMRGKTTCQVIDFTPYRTFTILNRYIENNTIFNDKSLDVNRAEFLNSVTLFESSDNGFKSIDLQSFKERVVDSMDISSKNFFGNYLIRKDEVAKDYNWLYEKLGHIESGVDKAETKERLDDNDIEKGKTKETFGEKKDKKGEELDKKLIWALENIEYFLGKTPLLSVYSGYEHDNINDCFNHIHENKDWEENYVSAISLDSKLNIDFEVAELVYRNYINNELLNDRILTFNTKIRKLIYTKNKYELVINIQKVLGLIDSYAGVSRIEKKLLGEVMTPQPLVREMLETLPEEVWTNPNLKWLEPANGSGVFVAVVVEKLMDRLKDFQPDDELRYKYIIENMIYVCELQQKNMFIYLNLFDPNHEYNMNWYRGSFLDGGFDKCMKEKWGIDGFDIVMGNPPYQEIDKNGKSKSGGNSLWSKFINNSLIKLKDNKYLCFINPSSWMSPGGHTKKGIDTKINKYDLLHLEIETARKYFDVGSSFTWYLLQKSITPNLNTKIKTLYNKKIYISEINLKKYDYLPLFLFDVVMSIKNKFYFDKKINFNVDYSFDQRNNFISKNFDDEFKYPLYHTSKQIKYSSKKHPFQNNKKVLITKSGNLSPFYDNIGEYGTTETSFYCLVDNDIEGNKIVKLLNSKIYKFYLNVFKWSGFHNPIILNSLPMPNISNDEFTDLDLYEYFNLTEEEINLIEETIK